MLKRLDTRFRGYDNFRNIEILFNILSRDNNMNKWLRKFEDIMAASAFAEAGEFETARDVLKERRRILLALTGDDSDRNAFRYALDMCRHKGADLDILYASEVPGDLLKQFRSDLRKERIECRLIQAGSSLEEDIENHTGRKRDRLFVIVEVSEDAERYSRKEDRILSDAWKNLQCPLAVISKGKTAFGNKDKTESLNSCYCRKK